MVVEALLKRLMVLVLAVGIFLQVSLSLVNLESVDSHMQVILFIRENDRVPEPSECFQCYQPMFYHYLMAKILDVFPVRDQVAQIKFLQALNCLAGVATLLVIYRFIGESRFPGKVKLVCLSLVALNPARIALSSQITNDPFVILFSTLALYFLHRFLSSRSSGHFAFMTAASILAAVTKVNGLVIAPGILFAIFARLWGDGNSSPNNLRRTLAYMLLFVVAYAGVVPLAGGYLHKYEEYGSPFAINKEKTPFPYLFQKTSTPRAGVTSIADAYMTFRYFDMIERPMITFWENYPLHRTSLWSHLYGSAHFTRFVPWPPSWAAGGGVVLGVGRVILALALIPTIFLVLGFALDAWVLFCSAFGRRLGAALRGGDWIFSFFFICFMVFMVSCTLQYRSFSTMNARYIMPGLLCFTYLMLRGGAYVYGKCKSNGKLTLLLDLLLVILIAMYILDIASLVIKLYGDPGAGINTMVFQYQMREIAI